MKKLSLSAIFVAAIITIAAIPQESLAYEAGDVVDITSVIEESADSLELSEWEKFIRENEVFSEISGSDGKDLIQYIKQLIKGESAISFTEFINTLPIRFIASVKKHLGTALLLLGIALICTLLDKLAKGLFKGSIATTASTVMFFCAVGLTVKSFADVYTLCTDCISNMTEFTDKALPVLMALVTAAGSSAATGILQPGLLMTLELTSKLIQLVIMPLLTASAMLSAAYSICTRKQYFNISRSVKHLADWIIGIMFTLFFGIISIQRLTSSAIDGACIKTIKYTISSFSLYGGSFLSKSFDIVTGCAIIMKNVLGGIGMIILLSICICPALELLAISVVYRISAFFISLAGEEKISGCLGSIGKIYGTMFLCTMTAAVLFFMLLSAIVSAGGSLTGI